MIVGFDHVQLGCSARQRWSEKDDNSMATNTVPSIRLRYATVKVRQLDRSLAFHEAALGLRRTATEANFVQLDAGGAELCIDLTDDGPHDPRLIFAVADLPALADRLQSVGATIVDRDPEQRWIMVQDHDGNDVVFEAEEA